MLINIKYLILLNAKLMGIKFLNIKKQSKKYILLLFLYYPWLDLLLFYSFVLRAFIMIGEIPSYNNPDPNSLGMETHQMLIYSSGDILPISLMVLIFCFFNRKRMNYFSNKHFLISFISFILVVLTFISPLSTWFAD